jgi:hypothetical protein
MTGELSLPLQMRDPAVLTPSIKVGCGLITRDLSVLNSPSILPGGHGVLELVALDGEWGAVKGLIDAGADVNSPFTGTPAGSVNVLY